MSDWDEDGSDFEKYASMCSLTLSPDERNPNVAQESGKNDEYACGTCGCTANDWKKLCSPRLNWPA